DKRDPTAESYEKVREIIEGRLKKTKREEAMNKLILDLKSRYNVIVDKDVFQSSQIVAEDSGNPANAAKTGSSINAGTSQQDND
ncbi:MAG TPA: hypothetical protein PLV52_02145, partial [Candidatus Omnitrophota bacterium]|nr:hypothetical protein [Candidatus Omnitrophota bacterium]